MEYVELWCNNDDNNNIRAGAKFDADCGAETSFPLTVALGGSTVVLLRNMTYLQPFPLNLPLICSTCLLYLFLLHHSFIAATNFL